MIKTSTELVRLEILVSRSVKNEIEKQAAQAKQPVNRYGGRLLAGKVKTFAEAANSALQLNIKLDAIIGALHANSRNQIYQLGDSSNEKIQLQAQFAELPLDIVSHLISNQLPG